MNGERPDRPASIWCSTGNAEIDAVCDAFEQQWQAGQRPDIDAYLEQVDNLDGGTCKF